MNVTFIAMMYGVGIPLLFPVAALNLAMTYVAERITLAYYKKLPPAMDDAMIKNALSIIKFSPLFLMINGYWMISNK